MEAGGGHVLSVQSHVVRGYVGNKAATFPLQLLGFEVDPLNAVHLSNHTGYPSGFKGQRLTGDQLTEVVAGLEANSLLNDYTHLLTGYLGSSSALSAVAELLRAVKKANPQVQFVCDPVLGDHGSLYVPADMVAGYRDQLVPHAQLLTPNLFEVAQLTGLPVATHQQVYAAVDRLHDMGPATVVVTSLEEGDGEQADVVTLLASTRLPQAQGQPSRFKLTAPRQPGRFTGTGDLLAALLLAHSHQQPDCLAIAASRAVGSLQAVLWRTAAAAEERPQRQPELQMVQSRQHFLTPPHLEELGAELIPL